MQTDGSSWTPLHIASQNGHLECVRALLGGGAAINQATVGCGSSMARHGEGCVGPYYVHAYPACGVRWETTRCRARDSSILMIGCGTLATEVVRAGMMCGLCVPRGVADDRGHAAVYHQSERARGVRAGAVGRGRCD
jgi:hypothetical protein